MSKLQVRKETLLKLTEDLELVRGGKQEQMAFVIEREIPTSSIGSGQ